MKWNEKFDLDPELREAFDKGITTGVIIAIIFMGAVYGIIKLFQQVI